MRLYSSMTMQRAASGDTKNVQCPRAAEEAAQQIHKACKGVGTDEKTLIKVLGSKSPEMRELIAIRYEQLYEKSLRDVMQSEASGDFGRLLRLISTPLPESEAQILKDATAGLGTTESLIVQILAGRTNDEIDLLKKAYFNLYMKDLSVTLNSELSGDFKKVVMALLQSPQEVYNPEVHNAARAEEEAVKLYKAGQGRLGTNEPVFIGCLVSAPPDFLKMLDSVYTAKYKNNIAKAVDKEFSGDARKALSFFVRLQLNPYPTLAELFESTMKGFGTDETSLSAALVRYQSLLPEIKRSYKQLYEKELRDRINGETSGDYRKLLLEICDAPLDPAIQYQTDTSSPGQISAQGHHGNSGYPPSAPSNVAPTVSPPGYGPPGAMHPQHSPQESYIKQQQSQAGSQPPPAAAYAQPQASAPPSTPYHQPPMNAPQHQSPNYASPQHPQAPVGAFPGYGNPPQYPHGTSPGQHFNHSQSPQQGHQPTNPYDRMMQAKDLAHGHEQSSPGYNPMTHSQGPGYPLPQSQPSQQMPKPTTAFDRVMQANESSRAYEQSSPGYSPMSHSQGPAYPSPQSQSPGYNHSNSGGYPGQPPQHQQSFQHQQSMHHQGPPHQHSMHQAPPHQHSMHHQGPPHQASMNYAAPPQNMPAPSGYPPMQSPPQYQAPGQQYSHPPPQQGYPPQAPQQPYLPTQPPGQYPAPGGYPPQHPQGSPPMQHPQRPPPMQQPYGQPQQYPPPPNGPAGYPAPPNGPPGYPPQAPMQPPPYGAPPGAYPSPQNYPPRGYGGYPGM